MTQNWKWRWISHSSTQALKQVVTLLVSKQRCVYKNVFLRICLGWTKNHVVTIACQSQTYHENAADWNLLILMRWFERGAVCFKQHAPLLFGIVKEAGHNNEANFRLLLLPGLMSMSFSWSFLLISPLLFIYPLSFWQAFKGEHERAEVNYSLL